MKPREGRDRPTPERLRRGDWETRDSERAGMSYAVDKQSHALDMLRERGLLSDELVMAGEDFARLVLRNRLTSEGRSCLNFDPVGYDNDLPDDAQSRELFNEVYLALGTLTYRLLRKVCVESEYPGPHQLDRLNDGLETCVTFFKK